jgi:HlyD family type I secretion membrane fusion protein
MATVRKDVSPTGPDIGRSVAVGVIASALFFGGLGSWATLAPLSSASLGIGVIAVEGDRKTVQHFEGGIVAAIHVQDGDRVAAGQLLVQLDKTHARAALDQLRARTHDAQARAARLLAERNGKEKIEFPVHLNNAQTAQIVAGERQIFATRQRALRSRAGILEQRIAQFEEEIGGLRGQIAAESRQLQLIGEEILGLKSLVAKKLSGSQRLLELQRRSAEIDGNRARRIADIARAKQNIAEERLKILDLDTTRSNEVAAELREVQSLDADLTERMRAANDVLERTDIKAPLAGSVVGLTVNTVGGVITPGQALLDIVPSDARLVVQARVQPEDIDTVEPGLEAQVVLTALNRRNTPPISGQVVSVSADRLEDQRTGLPYFLARIELPESTPQSPLPELYPGMQAEVIIVTGKRTALDYVLRPLTRAFDRALRED